MENFVAGILFTLACEMALCCFVYLLFKSYEP